jgi:hypothetical protein
MKSMRYVWILTMLLAWPAMAAETRSQKYEVAADVNASGEVTATQPPAGMDKSIAALLDLALKHWRFVPAHQDGEPVAVHTFIDARVDADTDANGKYTVHVAYLRHGPSWYPDSDPRYPPDSVRDRDEGIVVMVGKLKANGALEMTDVQTNSSLGNGNRSPLRKVATDWFLSRTVTPESVNGQSVPADVRAYVTFHLSRYPGPLPSPEIRLKGRDKELVDAAGFKQTSDGTAPLTPEISSVLQTSDVRPIVMHL